MAKSSAADLGGITQQLNKLLHHPTRRIKIRFRKNLHGKDTAGRWMKHKFYNQTSVLHTMSRMFGIPPMNQMVALAPLMTDCFTTRPNFKPYQCRPNLIPLDELNKATAQLQGDELRWALQSEELPLDEPDRADEDTLNRIIWHSVKGVTTPYPVALAGAHGKGLRKLGLTLGGVKDDD